jgi:hypothetical protein
MQNYSPLWLSAAALCLAVPALAATSTPYAKGGRTRDFAVDVERHRRSGELFRISGHCQYACTMFLAQCLCGTQCKTSLSCRPDP